MKKLILISALLLISNGWTDDDAIIKERIALLDEKPNERLAIVGVINMECNLFLKMHENSDENDKKIMGVEIISYLGGLNDGTALSRFKGNKKTNPYRDYKAHNLNLVLAHIINKCEKEKDANVRQAMISYWYDLPVSDEDDFTPLKN